MCFLKGNALKIPYKRRKENEFCFSLIIPCGARSYARRSVWSFCFYLSFSPITGNACGQDKSLPTWKYSSSSSQPTANSVSPARPRSTEECFGELYDCPLAYSFLLHISIQVTYLTSVRVFLSQNRVAILEIKKKHTTSILNFKYESIILKSSRLLMDCTQCEQGKQSQEICLIRIMDQNLTHININQN